MTSPYIDARAAAAELLVSLPVLKRMAAKREYPEMLFVSRGQYRVLRAAHESWKASRTIGAVTASAASAVELADQAAGHQGRRGVRRRAHGSSATFARGSRVP